MEDWGRWGGEHGEEGGRRGGHWCGHSLGSSERAPRVLTIAPRTTTDCSEPSARPGTAAEPGSPPCRSRTPHPRGGHGGTCSRSHKSHCRHPQ